jgi:hypothetical protein
LSYAVLEPYGKDGVLERLNDHDEMAAAVKLFAMAICHVTGVTSSEDVAITSYPH